MKYTSESAAPASSLTFILIGGCKNRPARRFTPPIQQRPPHMFYPQTIQGERLATATKYMPRILRKTRVPLQNSFDCNAVWSEHGTWFQEVRGTVSRTEAKRAWNVDPRLKLFQ
jgi:hypothetical protein